MKISNRNFDARFWQELEFYRFSIMMFTITFGTAFASVALYYVYALQNESSLIPVAILTFFAMGSNTSAISQSPLKWVITTFVLNIIISTLIICYAFFI